MTDVVVPVGRVYPMRAFKAGDVVQLDPQLDTFGGCFLVVTDVYKWGVMGYVTVPGKDGVAYYRAEYGMLQYIGHAEWVVGDGETTEIST